MTSKEALPGRYLVDRTGTPDPVESSYYVLDVVHDQHARTVLGTLAGYYRQYGQQLAADELESLLSSTSEAHGEVVRNRAEAAAARLKTLKSRKGR